MDTPPTQSFFRREAAPLLLLALAALAVWTWAYGRLPGTASFRQMSDYDGDALFTAAAARAFSEVPAPWNIEVSRLNAPFGANWNDYPLPEKLFFYPAGLLARFLDLGAAVNAALLLAHLAAAAGFYLAARYFGGGRGVSSGFALVFAYSPFLIHHGMPTVWCAHVPLMFVALDQVLRPVPRRSRRALPFVVGLAAASAWLNPYYGLSFLMLLGLAAAVWIARGREFWGEVRLPVLAGAAFLGAFLLGQLPYYATRAALGPNPDAVGRNLPSLATWGMRLSDLVLPSAHAFRPWSDFAWAHYYAKGALLNESQGAFLGVAGVLCLAAMGIACFRWAARGAWGGIPVEAWSAAAVFAFSVVGGGNYLLGSLGFVMLRATNRCSVLLLAAALLFVAARLWHRLPRAAGLALFAVLMGLAAWELSAYRRLPDVGTARIVASDRAFAAALESALPRGAMVFTLPVREFPEVPPLLRMKDYEPFRLYLWSRELRFSYGSDKGRFRERWQKEAGEMAPPAMAVRLEGAGFSAVVVDRNGYADGGAGIEAGLAGAGLEKVAEAEDGTWAAYRLRPVPSPAVPRPLTPAVIYRKGFADRDPDARETSAAGPADLDVAALVAGEKPSRAVRMEFDLEGAGPGPVGLFIDGRPAGSASLVPGTARHVTLEWTPRREKTRIGFRPGGTAFTLRNPVLVFDAGPVDSPRMSLTPP